jgi:predicted kinase
MIEVVFCVGIAASGKTTWAYKQEGYVVLDSDAVREELYGDATCQDNPDKVFNLIYKRAKDALREDKSVIFCSTNLTMKYRIHAIRQMKQVRPDAIIRAVVFNTPLEVCEKQNKMRERQVPDWLFMRQLKTLQLPVYNEGFDVIDVIHNYIHEEGQKVYHEILEKVLNFGDQKNEHHSSTLFEHCVNAYAYACDNNFSPYICGAALAHDFGKAWTQEYWKKDNGKNAHYPCHENVGAYLSLNLGNSYHCAQLINYHMLFYMDSRAQATWRKRLGEEFWHELELLHEADIAAH